MPEGVLEILLAYVWILCPSVVGMQTLDSKAGMS